MRRSARAAGQDAVADVAALVRDHLEDVRRLCALLVDAAGADDLAQETCARAVRSAPSYRGEASGRSWLLGIARHVCLDELRARTRRRRRDARMAPAQPSADASESVTVADLVTRLEPERRAAFVLTQLLGFSYAEAAAACGCPPGTIRSRVARARADLVALVAGDTEPVEAVVGEVVAMLSDARPGRTRRGSDAPRLR